MPLFSLLSARYSLSLERDSRPPLGTSLSLSLEISLSVSLSRALSLERDASLLSALCSLFFLSLERLMPATTFLSLSLEREMPLCSLLALFSLSTL